MSAISEKSHFMSEPMAVRLKVQLEKSKFFTSIIIFIAFRIVEDDSSTLMKLRRFHDSDNNGVVVLWSDFILNYFNLVESPYRRLSFTKDRLFMYNLGFYFRKKSLLTPLFNHELTKFDQSGLTRFWISNYMDDRKIKSKYRSNFKGHIENVFGACEICAFMYLISIVVFILEVISTRQSRIRCIIDYLTH